MTDLDVYDRSALDVGDGGYVRRYSTNPTQDANIDLAVTIAAGAFSKPLTLTKSLVQCTGQPSASVPSTCEE